MPAVRPIISAGKGVPGSDSLIGLMYVNVCEIFESVQGESTYAGLPCLFIRLSECNLRCNYCDTKRAYKKGRDIPIPALVARCRKSRAPLVEITGGEPLLQKGFSRLASALCRINGKTVLVETNGSVDISAVPGKAVAVIDVKCPGSGEGGSFNKVNLRRIRRHDEVKFVLTDEKDYRWAKVFVRRHKLISKCRAVLFSPVTRKLRSCDLAKWVLRDGLQVRLQIQLHRVLGVR